MLLAMAAMPTIDTALHGKSGTIYGNNVYDSIESQGTRDIYKGSTTSWKPTVETVGGGKIWGTTNNLLNSASIPGKGGVSPVGRAFQKHAGNPNRAGTFTGEVSGNALQNTQNGTKYLNDILYNKNSTFTVRNTKAYGEVLDVRLPDGTGARWSADGKTFIGFLEKYTK